MAIPFLAWPLANSRLFVWWKGFLVRGLSPDRWLLIELFSLCVASCYTAPWVMVVQGDDEAEMPVKSRTCSPRVSLLLQSLHAFSFQPVCASWCFAFSGDESTGYLSEDWDEAGATSSCRAALGCTSAWGTLVPNWRLNSIPCIRRQILDHQQGPSKWVWRKIRDNVRGVEVQGK